MKRWTWIGVGVFGLVLYAVVVALAVITPKMETHSTPTEQTYADLRKTFKTQLRASTAPRTPVDDPPPAVFTKLKYKAPVGDLWAYLTPDPKDGKKHPAILWIHGGDCNSIGECWEPGRPANDQTAAAYRNAGIVMMLPSLRGGNDNPGPREGFLGEVDDVLAAADFLASQPFVDPDRIYLGGHSTGATLVLLVAETSARFRTVFAFGPVPSPMMYGEDTLLPFDHSAFRNTEVMMRSPVLFMPSIKNPVYILEGTNPGSNWEPIQTFAKNSKNPKLKIIGLKDGSHFNVLAPMNEIIAQKIFKDEGPVPQISISDEDIPKEFPVGL